jgi:hypothetical protein
MVVPTYESESHMRESEVPECESLLDLSEYIQSLTTMPHDYGTCVYAMSMAATAAFNHVAGKLGVTGFQASCADLDVLRRTRRIDGPFMIVKGEDAMYPQCDPRRRLSEWLEEISPWLKEQAEKKLSEFKEAHPAVVAHWKKLSKYKGEPNESRKEHDE